MSWNAQTVRAELEQIATGQLGWKSLPAGDLSEALDSVDRLALVVAIEDHFKVAFEPEDDESANSIEAVVAIVLQRLQAEHHG